MEFNLMNHKILVQEELKKLQITTPTLNVEYSVDFTLQKEELILPLDENLYMVLSPVSSEVELYGISVTKVKEVNISIKYDNIEKTKILIQFE